jgi:hypothetical protein
MEIALCAHWSCGAYRIKELLTNIVCNRPPVYYHYIEDDNFFIVFYSWIHVIRPLWTATVHIASLTWLASLSYHHLTQLIDSLISTNCISSYPGIIITSSSFSTTNHNDHSFMQPHLVAKFYIFVKNQSTLEGTFPGTFNIPDMEQDPWYMPLKVQ